MRKDNSAACGPLAAQTESAKPSPKQGAGAVCARWVRCGKPWCRCMHDGPKHGPYYARYWWHDGHRHKAYVRKQAVTTVAAACVDRREGERERRAGAWAARKEWRLVRALVREVERAHR